MILKIKGDRQESWALWYLFSKFMVGSVYVSNQAPMHSPKSRSEQNVKWSSVPFVDINTPFPVLSRGSNPKYTHLIGWGKKSLSSGLSPKM